MTKRILLKSAFFAAVIIFVFSSAQAQTSAFTYQGKLTDASAAASGQYDFTFRLFDAASAGTQIGADVSLDNVAVSAGIFTVNLDFGANAFSTNATRFLEISVRAGESSGAYTPLAPRQEITSTPFSIKSLIADNTFNLGGLAASQYVVTTDFRLTDDRNPLPNSPNYLQNTTATQAASNFNISGNGTAGGTLSGNVVNAATQFNIGGLRVLTMNPVNGNLYGGGAAGSGTNNTFFGLPSGNSNSGFSNSFFGSETGNVNTGFGNSFFGMSSGRLNNSGSLNSFFGRAAGLLNTTGWGNTFVGANAGDSNNSGNSNSFFGDSAGDGNTSGEYNTFIGQNSGANNTTGSSNTMLGFGANVLSSNLTFATAIGAGATVNRNNLIVLGRSGGQDEVLVPGNAIISQDLSTNTFAANAVFTTQLQTGSLTIETLGAAGGTSLCRNASNQISNCSSSLRYKTNIAPFSFGLDFIKQLRPITFNWKIGGAEDIGFGAEDVAQISPLFVTFNEKGVIEGVKYDRLSVVFVNAFKEQQTQIERQQKQIDELKTIVCELKPRAAICREAQK